MQVAELKLELKGYLNSIAWRKAQLDRIDSFWRIEKRIGQSELRCRDGVLNDYYIKADKIASLIIKIKL